MQEDHDVDLPHRPVQTTPSWIFLLQIILPHLLRQSNRPGRISVGSA